MNVIEYIDQKVEEGYGTLVKGAYHRVKETVEEIEAQANSGISVGAVDYQLLHEFVVWWDTSQAIYQFAQERMAGK